MVNVGLRGFLWEQKSVEHKVAREVWSLNGASYGAYRAFVLHAKEHGFPDVALAQLTRGAGEDAAERVVERSSGSAASSLNALATQSAHVYGFAGMKHIFDDGEARGTVLRFARLSSELLAWGATDGSVRVAELGKTPRILHVLQVPPAAAEDSGAAEQSSAAPGAPSGGAQPQPGRAGGPASGHSRPAVTDLDWTLENDRLVAAAEDGSVCVWLVATGHLLRALRASSPARCCRFHQVNQNLVLVGTAAGEVVAFNVNIAKLTKDRARLPSGGYPEGVGAAAMAATPALLYVADSRGHVHTLRCELRGGALHGLVHLARSTLPQDTRPAAVVSLQRVAYAAWARGPTLLTSTADCRVCLYRLQDGSGRVEALACAQMPPAARGISAVLCPPGASGELEFVAMGGEDTGVYIWDVSRPGRPPLVVNKLQGHVAPVVAVSWSFDGQLLASVDCDGVVIVWRRERPAPVT